MTKESLMKERTRQSFFGGTAAIVMLLVLPSHASADITLPALIDHHMVIQRDVPFPVWGWADPREKVTVEFKNRVYRTEASGDGRFRVELEPETAGGPYEMKISGNNDIILHNILIGDIWVCSGQSNMEWPVKYCTNAEKEIASAMNPMLRLIEVKKTGRGAPQDDIEGQWQECTPHTVGDITGAGYFFCRALVRDLDIPVGLVMSNWGGTSIKQWTSLSAMESDPAVAPILDRYRTVLYGNPKEMNEYHDGLAGWFEYCFVQMHLKRSYNPIPQPPEEFKGMGGTPSWLYNGMIAPLTWMPIKGWAWYQGESNSGRAYLYRSQLPLLIQDWRNAWKMGDLPFIVVQLANWQKRKDKPGDSAIAELREAQFMTVQNVPNTALVVTLDIGEEDVHFRDKQPAGERMALAAMKIAYGKDTVHSGPVYRSMNVKKNTVSLTFDFAKGGLVTSDGGSPVGFSIAGEDSVFKWAEARIEKNKVVVWNDTVKKPAAVRYGWSNNPAVNLVNSANLPAVPFRTDNWPGITKRK